MLEQQTDRRLAIRALCQECSCHPIGGSVELIIGQSAVLALYRQPVTILARLLLEPVGNRLLDLFPLELDIGVRWTNAAALSRTLGIAPHRNSGRLTRLSTFHPYKRHLPSLCISGDVLDTSNHKSCT